MNINSPKLEKWANLLLDTGKRNNLINFKDLRTSTLEIVLPEFSNLLKRVENHNTLTVCDTSRTVDDEFEKYTKEAFIEKYSRRITKANDVLLYNSNVDSIVALKSIDKKAREYVEETGVNVAYLAMGFIHWRESDYSDIEYRAPILLAPIYFSNDSAMSPWYINFSEDDVVVNPTFNYKISNEYGITLPTYSDEGYENYIDEVEKAILQLGWTVSRECKLGIFSFLKLNMYKDLIDNQDKILDNNIVKLLLGEPCVFSDISLEKEKSKLTNPLIELNNVVDADSSQIEAIELAKSGVSFVLQGPPGTGKSQTITNIIAECIHDGKKVLFVSEKQAALNVVFDKLKKAGLEEFCLELHSHKANKKDVINELCRTLRTKKTTVSSKAEQIISEETEAQKHLDEYEFELHKVRGGIEKSLYQIYDEYSSYRNVTEIFSSINDIEQKGNEYLKKSTNLLNQYVDYIPTIGYQYKNNAWYGYINPDSSYKTREEIKRNIEIALTAFYEYQSIGKEISEKYSVDADTINKIWLWANYFKLAVKSNILSPSFLKKQLCDYLLEKLKELKALGEIIRGIYNDLIINYDEGLFELPADEYQKKLERLYPNWYNRIFSSEYNDIIKNIRMNSKKGGKPSYDKALELMVVVSEYQQYFSEFNDKVNPIKESFGNGYAGIETEWDIVIEQVEKLQELFDAGISFGNMEITSKVDYENSKDDFHDIAVRIYELANNSKENIEYLSRNFDKKIFNFYKLSIDECISKLEECLNEYDRIENWVRFRNLLIELEKNEITEYIDAAIKYNIHPGEFVPAYRKNFYYQWIDYIRSNVPAIAQFNRINHQKYVASFVTNDKLQVSINKAKIKAEISANRPSLDLVSSGSAVALLVREGEKKRKQKNIRVLFDEVGELVQVLKPCFLMSPLSVSTFLNTKSIDFDVVIFDEASQIFPQDAIGAIYRAKQVIVVGDSKQMPPSNFFNATMDDSNDDEETGDIADFESILDLCSASMPQLRLSWHYRSKYEQLITFSNKNFYDNSLITFPSVSTDRKWIGVDYYNAGGIYDRVSRSNRKEAEFVVDLIFENIKKYPNRSLGVVAFSVSQQTLIEKMLDQKRIENPAYEYFFKKDSAEPFFIKNLETVQGDERDTIIFSVAYAKDSEGRFLHNFGPLNKSGGERRLNVAITRAKINIQLVTSIHYTDIDLGRTNSDGARLLREYLDYAENGIIALERVINVDSFEQYDSEFELEVCEYLRSCGFEVDTQVGCSNFKIDLALKRPNSSDYVLAIECDGATYHSSKNARDRDRLRQQILESMGWKFYRIWSTDWFKNKSVEKECLYNACAYALKNENIEHSSEINDDLEENSSYLEEVDDKHFEFPKYEMANLYGLARTNRKIINFVRAVLDVEAPLSEEWLLKRIPWFFGREKVSAAVIKEYENGMIGCEQNGIIRQNGFLFLTAKMNYMTRVPKVNSEKREIKYICLEELAAGMLYIIKENVSVNIASLYQSLAKELGFHRVTDNIAERFDLAIGLLDELIEIDNGNVRLK